MRANGANGTSDRTRLDRALAAAVRDPALIRAAEALLDNDLAKAEAILRPHLYDRPTDVAAIRMMAELAGRIGRYADAETLLRRALELAPDFSAARANLATALCRGQAAADEAAETARRTFEEGSAGEALPTMTATHRITIIDALIGLGMCASKGEARRLIQGGGARIDGEKVDNDEAWITPTAEGVRISAGKKKHGLVLQG